MSTFFVGLLVAACLFAAVRNIYMSNKKGSSCHGCGSCEKNCSKKQYESADK